MKLSYGSVIFVAIILAAVLVAGCACSKTFEIGATPTPTAVNQTGTATPAGGLTTLGSAVDFSKVHWYEYQMTSKSGEYTTNTKIKCERNVDYQGKAADKYTMTVDTVHGGTATNMVTLNYVDKSGNNLGGHVTTTTGGQVVYDQDIPASGLAGTTSSDPLSTNAGAAMTGAGADTVTVPAGTYACVKYTYTLSDGATGTVWIAPNVPIPVKMDSSSTMGTISMELTGWG